MTCHLDQENDMTDNYEIAKSLAEYATGNSPIPAPSWEGSMANTSAASAHALLAIHDVLTEIRDRLPEPEVVTVEPADITEEPPVGSQVTDREGDVWERREGGWALWWPERSGWIADLYGPELDPWPVVRAKAPLRFTTDEDRKRVGIAPATDPEPCPTCGRGGSDAR